MAIDFPTSKYTVADGTSQNSWPGSPSSGDTATANSYTYTYNGTLWVMNNGSTKSFTGGATYTWDGEKWDASNIPDNSNVVQAPSSGWANGELLQYNGTTWDSVDLIIDEDNMSSDSDTKIPTQQSVKSYVDNQVASVVDSAPATLDTLNELAAALNDDANFATTVTTNLAAKLDASSVSTFGGTLIDDADAATARTTLGLGTAATSATGDFATAAQGTKADSAIQPADLSTVATSGSYTDLSNQPTIPSATSDLTNDSGFITADATKLPLAGGTMSGDIAMGSNKVTGLGTPSATGDAATKGYVDTQISASGGGTVTNVSGTAPISVTNGTTTPAISISAATTSAAGTMSSSDKSKLDGIAAGAEVNVQSDWNASSGDAAILNKPTIPTNNNQLTNGAGYITSADGGNADTVDGIQASSFLRSNANDTCTGEITFTSGIKVSGAFSGDTQASELVLEGTSPTITLSDTTSGSDDFYIHVASNNFYVLSDRDGVAGGWDSPHPLQLEGDTNLGYLFGNLMWHAGNDGSGSGLDADTLDGQHGSYYNNYNNLTNKPTIPTNNNQLTNGAGYITSAPTNNNQLTNGAGYITNSGGTTTATANTVAKRDASGDLTTRYFKGEWFQGRTTATDSSLGIGFVVPSSDGWYRHYSPANARALMGAGTSNFSGSYNDLSNKPTIPTNNNQLTNGAGYITSAPVTSVNGQTGAVTVSAGASTLQAVTDGGNTTTNNILVGTTSFPDRNVIRADGSCSFADNECWIDADGNANFADGAGKFNMDYTCSFCDFEIRFFANGNATFGGFVTAANVSDVRFKENITNANPQLEDVVALGSSLKNWDWKIDAPLNEELKDRRFLGLIAQEAEQVCPGLTYTVETSKQGAELTPEIRDQEGNVTAKATYEQLPDTYKAINHDILVMKLLGAVSELSAKVDTLQTELNELKNA